MDVISRLLLKHEFTPTLVGPARCPECQGAKPHHELGCDMDESLSLRGFMTASDRDAARARLEFTSKTTAPAPPEEP